MQIAMGLRASPAVSTASGLLEVVIGFDDFSQLVFRGAVTAIGIGMMAFHQFLESRLNFRAGRALLQPERMKRLALGVAHRPPLSLGARLCRTGTGVAELAQDIERVRRTHALLEKPADPSLCALVAADHPHAPGRQVPGERVLLKPRYRIIAHASEKIVGLVVFTDVTEAEAPVFVLAISTFRRPVARRLGAVRPVAARALGLQPAVLAGLDPDAII